MIDAFEHVGQFADVTVAGFGRDDPGWFTGFEDFEGVGASSEIEVGGGVFEDERVAHVEGVTFGHDPSAFGGNGGAIGDLVLSDHVIDRAAEPGQAGGDDPQRAAEKKLDEIGVVDMEIQQCAAGRFSIEVTGAAPTGRGGNAPESRGEGFAVALVGDGGFEPGPARPETHAHGRHEIGGSALGGLDDFACLGGGAG